MSRKLERLKSEGKIDTILLLPCIYKATSKTTGLSYIGQSTEGLYIRKAKHLKRFNRGEWSSKNKFYTAMKELGFEDFNWSILFTVENVNQPLQTIIDILNDKEKFYIKELNTLAEGYNYTQGGGHKIPKDYSGLSMSEKDKVKRAYYLANRRVKRSTSEYKEKYNARQNNKRMIEKTTDPEGYRLKVVTRRAKYKDKKSAYHKTRDWLDRHNARVAKRKAQKLLQQN